MIPSLQHLHLLEPYFLQPLLSVTPSLDTLAFYVFFAYHHTYPNARPPLLLFVTIRLSWSPSSSDPLCIANTYYKCHCSPALGVQLGSFLCLLCPWLLVYSIVLLHTIQIHSSKPWLLLECSLPEPPSPPTHGQGSAPGHSLPNHSVPASHLSATYPGSFLCYSSNFSPPCFKFAANVSVSWVPDYKLHGEKIVSQSAPFPHGVWWNALHLGTLTTWSSDKRHHPFTAHAMAVRPGITRLIPSHKTIQAFQNTLRFDLHSLEGGKRRITIPIVQMGKHRLGQPESFVQGHTAVNTRARTRTHISWLMVWCYYSTAHSASVWIHVTISLTWPWLSVL